MRSAIYKSSQFIKRAQHLYAAVSWIFLLLKTILRVLVIGIKIYSTCQVLFEADCQQACVGPISLGITSDIRPGGPYHRGPYSAPTPCTRFPIRTFSIFVNFPKCPAGSLRRIFRDKRHCFSPTTEIKWLVFCLKLLSRTLQITEGFIGIYFTF